MAEQRIVEPRPFRTAVGMVFLPAEPGKRRLSRQLVEKALRDEGLVIVGWRRRAGAARGPVPAHASASRASSRSSPPRRCWPATSWSARCCWPAAPHRQRPCPPAHHQAARRPVRVLAVVAHRRLQGHAHLGRAAPVLPGPAGPRLRQPGRRVPPALQHQLRAQVESGAAHAPAGPQRRDQHAARQSRLDARPGAGAGGSACWGSRLRGAAAGGARRRQRLRLAGQARRAAGAQRPRPARGAHAGHAGGLRGGHGGGRRRTRASPTSTSTTAACRRPGTGRPWWPSPTAAWPAPAWTATACARRATRAPAPASSRSPPRPAPSTWTTRTSSRRAVWAPARWSPSIWMRAGCCATRPSRRRSRPAGPTAPGCRAAAPPGGAAVRVAGDAASPPRLSRAAAAGSAATPARAPATPATCCAARPPPASPPRTST